MHRSRLHLGCVFIDAESDRFGPFYLLSGGLCSDFVETISYK